MAFTIFTRPRLRVLSALSSDTAVVLFAAGFASNAAFLLTGDILLGMVFAYFALLVEEILEDPSLL